MLKCINNTKILQFFSKYLVILCIVACILAFFLTFSTTANAQASYKLSGITSNSTLQYDNKGVYVTSFNGSNLEINYISDTAVEKRSIKISGEIKSVAVDSGIIYAISYYKDTLYINRYIYLKDTLNSFIINGTVINSNYKFAVSGDRMYFAESEDYNTIACYSIYGEKLYSFYVNMVIDYRTDNKGSLYIFARNQIYTVNTTGNYQPEAILSTTSIRANAFICNNILFDYSGYIINLQNGNIISTNIQTDNLNCAVINEYYCVYSNGYINGYTENKDTFALYNIDVGENAQMCYYNDKLYLLSSNRELFIIYQSELNFPQADNNFSDNSSSINNDFNQNNNNYSSSSQTSNSQVNNNTTTSKFSINSYYIDSSKNIIWNIPSGTTIAGFKNNLTYNGYELSFYNNDNVKKTSGKIGTGYTMLVENNGTEYRKYIISVKGDLSGEGSVNKSDVKILSKYLMGGCTLTDEQYAASDCNNDNIIDGIDILKIARNNL